MSRPEDPVALIENLTPFAVGEFVGLDPQGNEVYCAIAKGTYRWDGAGNLEVAETQTDLATEDVYSGAPGTSGLLAPTDIGFPKPRVDVILSGEIVLPQAVREVDAALQIGTRLRKVVRISGDRVWMPGAVATMTLTKPVSFSRMSIAWERSVGGSGADDRRFWEPRNPAGTGLYPNAKAAHGRPGPNFESPTDLLLKHTDRPAPVGLGAIAPHWQPRIALAGTYDERWMEDRFPLLPLDFRQAFFNVAPADQQLDEYRPGEDVQMLNLTSSGRARFKLPAFDIPITIADDRGLDTQAARVDTLMISPADHTLSVIARAMFRPHPDALAIRQVMAGHLTAGRRRALERGKRYAQLRAEQ